MAKGNPGKSSKKSKLFGKKPMAKPIIQKPKTLLELLHDVRITMDELGLSRMSFKARFEGSNYYTHNPAKYIVDGTIDEELLLRLKSGAKLLSVGVGPGILETVLSRLTLNRRNIHLADKEIHPALKNNPLKRFRFDATEKWPINETYDYIIFPESFNAMIYDGNRNIISIYEV